MTKASLPEKQKRNLKDSAVRVHHAVRRQYRGYMPDKKRHRILLWVAFLFVSTIVAGQMLYPPDRGLPFASISGTSVAWRSYTDTAKVITEKFDNSKLQLVLDDKKASYSVKELGAEPSIDEMVERTRAYPFWQRFIPGSILWQSAQVKDADVYYSTKILQAFVSERVKDFSYPAKDAHLEIKEGKLVADTDQPGSEADGQALQQAISSTRISMGGETIIQVPHKQIRAHFNADDLSKVRSQAESALSHSVAIVADGKLFSPSTNEVASWLVLSGEGQPTLSVDKEKIKAYLKQINDQVGVPAGQTNINLVDGREADRQTGKTGRAIDSDRLADQLAEAILAPPKDIRLEAQFVDVLPSVIFNSKYTTTQEGLRAYVDDAATNRNMHIVIQQLDGPGWSAHARETESIPSASTYKLFIAKILFDKIDAGEIHWDDPMLDTDVAGCFERMTVASTNPCAESWIAQWGRDYINQYVYRLGFSAGTSFTTGGAVQTTAADLNRYMTMLYNGTILSGANRDRLLDSLGRHPYRYGIPTGSQGEVHDKVGFLWDYVHDTAIVQHPRGTYIMTVMTKGQSYAAIAAVTRDVERIMYP
ncbi:MAG TPA: serine hydrolase [Candidatus Saccharimonadales bacterium]|nr:serine hydrolase [Candidatus Saccharimonadales bacterium]